MVCQAGSWYVLRGWVRWGEGRKRERELRGEWKRDRVVREVDEGSRVSGGKTKGIRRDVEGE